jgi:hypothetical protein
MRRLRTQAARGLSCVGQQHGASNVPRSDDTRRAVAKCYIARMRNLLAAGALGIGVLVAACGGSSGNPDPSVGTSEDPIRVLQCPVSPYCDGHPPPQPCYQLACNYLWTLGHPGPVPTCVEVPISAGAPCSDALNCVAAGTCDGYAVCRASRGQQEVCTQTALGALERIPCLACANFVCQAFEGNETVPAPSLCQASWQ